MRVPGFTAHKALQPRKVYIQRLVSQPGALGVIPAQGIEDVGDCFEACVRLYSFCVGSGGIGCDFGYDLCLQGCVEVYPVQPIQLIRR